MADMQQTDESPNLDLSSPSNIPAVAKATRRDRALDVLRGLAIVVMTTSHVAPVSRLNMVMHVSVWMSAADAFVLVSGATLGLRAAQATSAGRLNTWLVRRGLTLWCIHFLLSLTVIAVHHATGRLLAPEVAELGGWWRTVVLVVCFRVQPLDLMNILPMYVVFLLVSPLAVLMVRRGQALLVLLISAAIWFGAQRNPSLIPLPAPTSEEMVFSLAAWQFAFITGLVVGFSRDAIERKLRRRHALLGRLGACLVGIMFLAAQLQRPGLGSFRIVNSASAEHWISKQTWGSVHALYATGLLIVGYSLVRWWQALTQHRLVPMVVRVACNKLMKMVESIGQKSLRCFLLHLVPALLASAFQLQERELWLQELSVVAALAWIYGVAVVDSPGLPGLRRPR